jgi:hypothetical protein
MHKSEQYRQFADSLAAAAMGADPATHDLLLETAAAWLIFAAAADGPVDPTERVVDFARAARRLRGGAG